MTELEAARFVTEEIEARMVRLTDAQRGDWIKVARATNCTMARQIVREIETDPDERYLTCKAFSKRLRAARGASAPRPDRKVIPCYRPTVRCLEAPRDHPGWAGREWSVGDTFRAANGSDRQYVVDYAHRQAAQVQVRYGGQWVGEVRDMDQGPYRGPLTRREVRQECEIHILDGPETFGQKWLKKRRRQNLAVELAQSLPKVSDPPAPRMPDREMLERIGRPVESSEPIPQADAAFFDAEEALLSPEPGREPGQEG